MFGEPLAKLLDEDVGVVEQTVDEISRAISPAVDEGLSFEQASAEFMAALEGLPGGLEAALAPEVDIASAGGPTFADAPLAPLAPNAPNAPNAPDAPNAPVAPNTPPALPELERFLNRIHLSRQKKAV